MANTVHSQKFAQRHPRFTGLLVLSVALGIAKWQIYDPLHASEYGYTNLHNWPKLIGFAIVIGLYGAALCLFGNRIKGAQPGELNNVSWRTVLAGVGIAAMSLGTYIYVMHVLNEQGYNIRPFFF